MTPIPKTRTLPAVLIPDQVSPLIEAVKTPHWQVFFRTAYTCGLRPGDARHLTPQDVDADRMLLHVRTTKGRNDRCVPMPQATLDGLREYWKTHHNPNWLFPARADLKNMATATNAINHFIRQSSRKRHGRSTPSQTVPDTYMIKQFLLLLHLAS